MDIQVIDYDDSGCLVSCLPTDDSSGIKKPSQTTFKPDFLLVRNQIRGPTPVSDNRNDFYGMMMGNIPSINSTKSCYLDLERPMMVGSLIEIRDCVGFENFPFISISYYSHPEMIEDVELYPTVMKVSHAHAGMGKSKIRDEVLLKDISSALKIESDYCTLEPYIKTEYGIRVQKIGDKYRVYKKNHTGSGWKSQFGGSDLQEIPLTDKYKFWADACARCYGGMDLLAVDAVHGYDGQDYIIELNGSAIGIVAHHWEEDSKETVDLVIDEMNSLFLGIVKSIENKEESKKRRESEIAIRDSVLFVESESSEDTSSISRFVPILVTSIVTVLALYLGT